MTPYTRLWLEKGQAGPPEDSTCRAFEVSLTTLCLVEGFDLKLRMHRHLGQELTNVVRQML